MTDPAPMLFDPMPPADQRVLCEAYASVGRTLDDLPYTEDFERLLTAAEGDASRGNEARSELLHRLHNLRKASRLPKLGRAQSGSPPRVDADQEQLLVRLVEAEVGRLSLRDRLPYTPAFDRIVERFNAGAGVNLSPHSLWRVVAKLAK